MVKKGITSIIETESSFIISAEYNFKNKRLTLLMKSGSYKYFHVSVKIYYELLESKSTGKYFNQNIRDKYNYERM